MSVLKYTHRLGTHPALRVMLLQLISQDVGHYKLFSILMSIIQCLHPKYNLNLAVYYYCFLQFRIRMAADYWNG